MNYYYYSICVTFILSTFLIDSIESNRADNHLFTEHYKRVANYECRLPKPRVFHINELISTKEQLIISTDYRPLATVLHRCDKDSGCCQLSNHVCSPKFTEDVDLVFATLTRPIKYLHVTAVNHTSCVCNPKNDNIK